MQAILRRDLDAVHRSVEAYPDDASLWAERPGLPNSGGTLVLHLAGNLQHFVGAVLGGSGYRRDRPSEFSRRDVPREALVAEIETAQRAVERALSAMPDEAFEQPYPESIGGRTVATGDLLVHLAVHLAYHLGQIDYHRRLVTGDARSIGAVAITDLPEWRPA
jgi:uncharacterized damage-inducible protein DinB